MVGIERLNGNPEAERQAEIRVMTRHVGDSHAYIMSLMDDFSAFVSSNQTGSIISDSTEEIGMAAGWNPTMGRRIIDNCLIKDSHGRINFRHGSTTLSLYINFFSRYKTAESIEHDFEAAISRQPENYALFHYLFQFNPIFAASTVILYDRARADLANPQQNEGNRPFAAWYVETIDTISKAGLSIYDFFGKIKGKVNPSDSLTQNFLSDWKLESDLPLAEAANLATATALHTQINDCAVLATQIPATIKHDQYRRMSVAIMDLWEPRSLPDGRTPVYNERSSIIEQYNHMHPTHLYIPVYSNVVDVVSYVKFMERYWQQLASGMQAKKGATILEEYSEDSTLVRLGNAVKLFCRETGSEKGQARISLNCIGSLQGFTIRVDNEGRRLSVDFGGITANKILAYAQEVKRKDAESPSLMEYSQTVNQFGELKRDSRSVPTIMKSTATFMNEAGIPQILTDGEKASLVAAVAMQEGDVLGLRGGDYYTYHSRQYLNKPEYLQNFHHIIRSLKHAIIS